MTHSELSQYVKSLYEYLCQYKNPLIAEKQTKYMRHQFPFLGLMNQTRSHYWKEFQTIGGKISLDDLVPFCDLCIRYNDREMWYTAVDELKKYRKKLKRENIDFVEKMIVQSDWWDIVDSLATNVVGSLCILYPELQTRVNDWIFHPNMWLRRTAILYQLGYKKQTDEVTLYSHIRNTAHEKEFFIRKAIGWALREYSKTNPNSVKDFISSNYNLLSPLSIREGEKKIK